MDALREPGVSGVCGVPGLYGGVCGVRGGLPGVKDIVCDVRYILKSTCRARAELWLVLGDCWR